MPDGIGPAFDQIMICGRNLVVAACAIAAFAGSVAAFDTERRLDKSVLAMSAATYRHALRHCEI